MNATSLLDNETRQVAAASDQASSRLEKSDEVQRSCGVGIIGCMVTQHT